ncbi:MAG: NAD(P)H-binding protein [Actinomycetota bacterium]|nr:NAD(P)H-binding protein [Actinomycetota bacterium]
MSRIVLIGGHGKVALQLARLLAAAGEDATSVIRNPAQSDDVAATGATPAVLDVQGASTEQLAGLFAGHDAVVWSAGAGGGSPERTYAVDRDAAIRSMDAAGQAGVQRYVMVSYLGARRDHGVPADNGFFAYAEAKAAADEYLRGTDLLWTVLGPGALTEDSGTDKITIGADPASSSRQTSRANAAAVAAAVLDRPGTAGRTIEFTDGNTPIQEALDALR